MSIKFSRRDFLKVTGLAVGGAALTCSGLGYAATRSPKIYTLDLVYGKEHSMQNAVLVTHATRAGSTAEIAAVIGETLAERGFHVDVKSIKSQPSLDGYTAVILGSAIRMGNWLPEMVKFIQANQAALAAMPTALFTVHMLNTGEDADSRAAREAYTASVRALLPDAENVFFTGLMDFSRLSPLDRFISGMVKAVEADHRDWDAIRRWAEAVLIN
ncbi:MAG TPA: flavodoxin domain-containing protein [Anaerolineae bacterium]|nr:flavodoxin domain-containing protein [Anaerolineae bacterium]HQI85625.1 flavodoxin domain-containing protein [Anaerolineae bacterium]